MKKILLCVASFMLVPFCMTAQGMKSAMAIFDREFDTLGRHLFVNVYADSIGSNIIATIYEDTINENYIYFDLLGKTDSRYRVTAHWSLDGSIICSGWIVRTIPMSVGVYGGPWIKVYWQPTYGGASFIYVHIHQGPRFKVEDFYGTWIKIRGKDDIGQSFCNWIPIENQCSSVYTTCN